MENYIEDFKKRMVKVVTYLETFIFVIEGGAYTGEVSINSILDRYFFVINNEFELGFSELKQFGECSVKESSTATSNWLQRVIDDNLLKRL